MKRLFVSIMLILLLTTSVLAAPASLSSGLKTADAAIVTTSVLVTGVLIITNGTDNAAIIVYDNASAATGTVLFKGTVAGAANFGGATWETPVRAKNGIYVDITGTDAAYIIYYNID